jgi:hypothetical protein
MIRIIAKLFAVTVALTAFLPVQPSAAEGVAFVSASGGGTACTQTAPCGTILQAIIALPGGGGRIVCITPVEQSSFLSFAGTTIVFDCPSTTWVGGLIFSGGGVHTFQHSDFNGLNAAGTMFQVTGGGTLIFDDCSFEDFAGIALDIEPNGPLNLVIKNSRISNNTGAGVLIKPAAGGSVMATFDGVTIVNNAGGLKTDTTNGPVTVDVFNSTISKNANNGLVALGGAGGQNMMTVKNDVIASNGQAGIESSGGTAGVLVNNTVLDSNIGGATLAVSGGRILTYGNNSTIGTPGSGFTGTAPLN